MGRHDAARNKITRDPRDTSERPDRGLVRKHRRETRDPTGVWSANTERRRLIGVCYSTISPRSLIARNSNERFADKIQNAAATLGRETRLRVERASQHFKAC
jgi:hypothetical protein